MNYGYCNRCNTLVPASQVERDAKIFLRKVCPQCGPTETLIAGDAARYKSKRALDSDHAYRDCKLDCLQCRHKDPNIVFVDITNRCNMNCPICINNTPKMGFLFEPPIEYFEKIFRHYSQFDPRPSIQLFGGEPTVRKDLLDIIKMARGYGLPTRVVTNGIKLADEAYCRALIENRATILIAYDGDSPETYRRLRGSEKYLALKQKAIENIRRIGGAKTVLMSLFAKGFNDKDLPGLLAYAHERREFIRGIYFMPLAQTWDRKDFDLEPDRVTSEDLETMVNAAFPEQRVDFIPAGLLGQLPHLRRCLKIKPLPFVGAHPNCESMYLLVSNGERFVPISHYFTAPVPVLAQAMLDAERRLARVVEATDRGAFGKLLAALRLKTPYLRLRALLAVGRPLFRHARVGMFFKGRGPLKLYHALALPLARLFGARSKTALARHTTIQGTLQLIVLPFEDNSVLETERLERCPAAFAFYDPALDQVRSVPVCAWGKHKTPVLRLVAEHYGTHAVPVATETAEPDAAPTVAG